MPVKTHRFSVGDINGFVWQPVETECRGGGGERENLMESTPCYALLDVILSPCLGNQEP